MSDKEFWTEVYLHAVKQFITKYALTGESLDNFEKKQIDISEHFECHCGYLADMALEGFKDKMKDFAQEAKEDIKKKEAKKNEGKNSLR